MPPRPKLDLNLLESLHVLLSERNVTHAAQRLGITQPALSAQLRRLREALDDPLLVKAESGRGMVLTPRAAKMARTVHSAIELLQGLAEGSVTGEGEPSPRTFRIAANDYALHRVARDLIASTATPTRAARFVFTAPRYPMVNEALESGDIDLLLDTDRNVPPGLRARVISVDPFVVAQRRNHPRGAAPLSIDGYCSLTHIVVSTIRENLRGHMDDILGEMSRERDVVAVIESFAAVPMLLTSSDHVATLPEGAFEAHLDQLDTFALPFKSAPYRLSMAWHPRSDKDEGLRQLRERIQGIV